jgi:hypothetical protein
MKYSPLPIYLSKAAVMRALCILAAGGTITVAIKSHSYSRLAAVSYLLTFA